MGSSFTSGLGSTGLGGTGASLTSGLGSGLGATGSGLGAMGSGLGAIGSGLGAIGLGKDFSYPVNFLSAIILGSPVEDLDSARRGFVIVFFSTFFSQQQSIYL
jgi:hypothetical protein